MNTDNLLEIYSVAPEVAGENQSLREKISKVHAGDDARKILEELDTSDLKSQDFSDLSYLMTNEYQARSRDRFCRMYGFPKVFLSDIAIREISSQDKPAISSNIKKALEISFEEISKDKRLSKLEVSFWQEDIFNYLRLLALYGPKESLEENLSTAKKIFPNDLFFKSELQKITSIKSPGEAQQIHLVRHKVDEEYYPYYSYSDARKFPVFEPNGGEKVFRYKDLTMTITHRNYTNDANSSLNPTTHGN